MRDSGAVVAYLSECARIAQSGLATDEISYYSALTNLLDAAGAELNPVHTSMPSPAAREGAFPDLALYEKHSQVLVIPVEVKPAHFTDTKLLALEQARRYASSFGGGHVILTNLWQFLWADLDPRTNTVTLRHKVSLLKSPEDLIEKRRPKPIPNSDKELAKLLQAACAIRPTITNAHHVASLLAYHAHLMVERIGAAGHPQTILKSVSKSMRDGLGMHLEDDFFSPTIVQTLIYGLFASWLDAPEPNTFNWHDASHEIGVDVIAELFHAITDPGFVSSCDLRSHLDAAARVLQRVDRDAFVKQFDDYAIEYFYEPFLAQFDPHLRDKLGVWYTPRQIAEYQVRRVDHELRQSLNIDAGLADEQVIILDPACGTGTYLRAVLDCIYAHHLEHGEPPEIAAQRTRRAAVTRVIGFEVLPAAFVIGHLHISRHLKFLNARLTATERLRIYLTNSLLGWGRGKDSPPEVPLAGLEKELRASLEVKATEPVLVVIGNPPYEGYSAAEEEEERALIQDWIRPLWTKYRIRKHRLGDLYVRFWRVAVHKIADITRRGVVCFITNRKWLGGRSFPVMREHIVHHFQRIVVDDLHGDVHDTTHPGDGSIFSTDTAPGIQRGTAITTLTRTKDSNSIQATVFGRSLRGSGAAKRNALSRFDKQTIDDGLEQWPLRKESRWRIVADQGGDDAPIDEYFTFCLSGVQPVRDDAVVDFSKDRLKERMNAYFDQDISLDQLLERYPSFGVKRSGYDPEETRKHLLHSSRFDEGKIIPFLYNPLDVRWLYWERQHSLLHRPRPELVPYYMTVNDERSPRLVDGQVALIASQTPRRPLAARPAFSSAVPRFHVVDPDGRVFPRIAPELGNQRINPDELQFGETHAHVSNVRAEWLDAARRIGIKGSDIEVGDIIFFALAAVSYAPTWALAIGTDNDDFAQLPIPSTASILRDAAQLGKNVTTLVDPSREVTGVTKGTIKEPYRSIAIPQGTDDLQLRSGNTRSGGRYEMEGQCGLVRWNSTGLWHNVPEEVWSYSLGGFQVLPKWLSYRHHRRAGYTLTAIDIETVTKLCRRLYAVIQLEPELERVHTQAKQSPLEI